MSTPDGVVPDVYGLQPSVIASSRSVRPGVHLLVVVDELDMATAPQLRAAAAAAMRDDCRVLAVDLEGVCFVASAGLDALLRIHQRASATGRELVLVSVPHAVRRVIQLIGLGNVLVQHETLQDALSQLNFDGSDRDGAARRGPGPDGDHTTTA